MRGSHNYGQSIYLHNFLLHLHNWWEEVCKEGIFTFLVAANIHGLTRHFHRHLLGADKDGNSWSWQARKEEQQMTERLKSSQEGRARLMYLMYLPIHDKANKIVAAYIVIVIV